MCRRTLSAPLEYAFPDGPLVKSLLAHISSGHTRLTARTGEMTSLFVSRPGNQFSNTTFCHFWKSLMKQVNKQEYFPPSLLRTMFVEEYTSAHGAEPDMWDGCAAIMGNSVAQWSRSYNPSAKRRKAKASIHSFTRRRESKKAKSDSDETDDE